jgi:hypothetical protein
MIPLIPIAYLNEECFLSLNTDDKKYTMALKDAQMDLEDILGSEFFDQIESQYDGDTLSTDNDALYEDYIKEYLAWQTYFHYLKFANADPTPSGVREFNDENSSILSDVKMYSFEKNVREKAVRYKHRMINFLKLEQSKDSTKYSLWEDTCKEEYSFAITAIDKGSDAMVRVNKAIDTNE